MPELPEVETVRRGLAGALEGRRLVRVEARRPDLRWPLPERFAERLTGRRVERLRRRSKYLLADLDTPPEGAGETWVIHLGMSGRILIGREAPRVVGAFVHDAGESAGQGAHDHVVIDTDAGARVVYNDARRFGAMDLWPTDALAAHRWLARLGPEPLDAAFDGAALARRVAGKTTTIKAALLDQRVVAGLGNIYVCEALHRSAIAPTRLAGAIAEAHLDRLAAEIRTTLAEAIEAGGSSLRDYRRADGSEGGFQHVFRVYGRTGEPCPRAGCRGRIERLAQAGRSTFHCSRCQR
ncbi:MAG: bifunctional DNA-formamidopyrimidine glycosylase/DNA-(apurinic or apyrimidinic site) lyase [Paracoccaceae bacterium]